MDKKTRKRIQTLRERLQSRQQALAGAKQQPDDRGELERLEQEIAAIREELRTLAEH